MKIRTLPRLLTSPLRLAVFLILFISCFTVNAQNTKINGIKSPVSKGKIIPISSPNEEEKVVQKSAIKTKITRNSNEPEWLLDNPASPVKITLAKRQNHLFFQNTSGKEISEIRIGIVSNKNKKYKIFSKTARVKINGKLPDGEVQFTGVADYAKDIDSAIEKKLKLAVLRVKFSDGSSWQIKDQPNISTGTVSEISSDFYNVPNTKEKVLPQQNPFDEVPVNLQNRLSNRLKMLIDYQRNKQWGNLYDLLSFRVIPEGGRETYIKRNQNWYTNVVPEDLVIGFVPADTVEHEKSTKSGWWTIYGCAKLHKKGKTVYLEAAVDAYRERRDWYFSGIGVITPIDGSAKPCQENIQTGKNSK